MVSQRLNQQRLETYLSASSNPTYDVTAHMESSQNTLKNSTRSNHAGGTSTPRDLNTRLKLLELYTLHVLPQNGEWDYARDFISMSEVLDEERREAFVHALQTLQEEKDHDAIREKELRRRQEEEMQQRREDEEKRRRDEARQQEERRQRETDEKHRQPTSRNPASRDRGPSAASSGGRPQPHATTQAKKQQNPRGKAPSKRPPPTPPPSIYRRTTSIMQLMQTTLLNMRQSVVKNPMVLLRFILFLLAFAMAFGRRDVRERVKRSLHHTWDKVRRTVGMGVKVSYI